MNYFVEWIIVNCRPNHIHLTRAGHVWQCLLALSFHLSTALVHYSYSCRYVSVTISHFFTHFTAAVTLDQTYNISYHFQHEATWTECRQINIKVAAAKVQICTNHKPIIQKTLKMNPCWRKQIVVMLWCQTKEVKKTFHPQKPWGKDSLSIFNSMKIQQNTLHEAWKKTAIKQLIEICLCTVGRFSHKWWKKWETLSGVSLWASTMVIDEGFYTGLVDLHRQQGYRHYAEEK